MPNNGSVPPGYRQKTDAANARFWGQISGAFGQALNQYARGSLQQQGVNPQVLDLFASPARAAVKPPAPPSGPVPRTAAKRVANYGDAQGNVYDGNSGRLLRAAAPAAAAAAAPAAAASPASAPPSAAAPPAGPSPIPGYAGDGLLDQARSFLGDLKANGGRFEAPVFAAGDASFQANNAAAAEGLARQPLREGPASAGPLGGLGGQQPAAATRAAMSDSDLEAAQTRAFMDAPDTALGAKRVRELLHGELQARGVKLDGGAEKYSIGALRQQLAGTRTAAIDGSFREAPAFTPEGTAVQPFGDGKQVAFQPDKSGLDGPQGNGLVPRAEARIPALTEVVDGYMTSPGGLQAKLAANPANQAPLDQPASWQSAPMVIRDSGDGVDQNMLAALASSGLRPKPGRGEEVQAALNDLYYSRKSKDGLYSLGYVDPSTLPPAGSLGQVIPPGWPGGRA